MASCRRRAWDSRRPIRRASRSAPAIRRTPCRTPLEMPPAPLPRGLEKPPDRAAVLGDGILDPGRDVRKHGAVHQAFALQIAERGGENFVRNRRHPPAELVEPLAALLDPASVYKRS